MYKLVCGGLLFIFLLQLVVAKDKDNKGKIYKEL